MARRVIAFAAIMIFLFIGAYAISTTHQDSLKDVGNNTTVINETWTVTAGEVQTLDNSNLDDTLYNESVTVYQNGSLIEADGNYTWFDNNGTIAATDPTNMNESQDANVTYSFFQATDDQAILVAIATIPLAIGSEMMLLAIFAVFVLAFMLVARSGL